MYSCASKRRAGRVVEGTSLLRKHTGLNLYRGFESLALRQKIKAPAMGLFFNEGMRTLVLAEQALLAANQASIHLSPKF